MVKAGRTRTPGSIQWWMSAGRSPSSHTAEAPASCSRGAFVQALCSLLDGTPCCAAPKHCGLEPTPWRPAQRALPNWAATLQPEQVHLQMRCSPHIRGKAVGLLGQYLWRHEAGGADHALVLLASILSRGCQTKVTCSRLAQCLDHGSMVNLERLAHLNCQPSARTCFQV